MAPPAPKPGQTEWADPCPVCGGEVTEWSADREMFEVADELVPAWDGGPLIPVPLTYPRLEPGEYTYTYLPCGHTSPQGINFYTRALS